VKQLFQNTVVLDNVSVKNNTIDSKIGLIQLRCTASLQKKKQLA
jgi:hypothetical protein